MLISNQAHCRSLRLLLIGLATLAACEPASAPDSSPGKTLSPQAAGARFNTTSVTEPETGPWARIVDGKVGPGALYRLYIPRAWNGDAVYYAHGVRDETQPVTLDDDTFAPIGDIIGAQGFAIAFSAWSPNGFVIKDAAQRVHQLRGLLTAELPHPPSRSFVVGSSFGGGVALDVLQNYPTQYDGGLLLCGMVGGSMIELEYAGHVRVLFDAFYPGALAGSALSYPPNTPFVTLAQVKAAVQPNPTPMLVIASLVQTPLPYVAAGNPLNPSSAAFQTLVSSLWTPLMFHSRLVNQLVDLTHGHSFFDNSRTMYALGANPLLPASQLQPLVDVANATVVRYTGDVSAVNYDEHYFTPTGDLRIPVLTLRNALDPAMPAFHDTALYNKVVEAGATRNLLQRSYPGYGHCAFSPAVVGQNFFDMVNWATTGVKP